MSQLDNRPANRAEVLDRLGDLLSRHDCLQSEVTIRELKQAVRAAAVRERLLAREVARLHRERAQAKRHAVRWYETVGAALVAWWDRLDALARDDLRVFALVTALLALAVIIRFGE